MLALLKGYQPGLPQLLAVLGMTEDIASQQWRDPLPPPSSDTRETAAGADPLDPGSACWGLVESIRVRKMFGGMGGDIAMLGKYEALWKARFADGGEAGGGLTGEAVPPSRGGGRGRAGWLGFLTAAHGRSLADPAGDKAGLGGYGAATGLRKGGVVAAMGQSCAAVIAQQEPLRVLAASLALRRSDIPPSAIDFHCSNVMETLLGRVDLRRVIILYTKSFFYILNAKKCIKT